MASIERIKQNAEFAKKAIQDLKSELNFLNNEYNSIVAKELREENARLLAAVEEARAKLVQLEVKNGVPQIPVPNQAAPTVRMAESEPPQGAAEAPKEEKVKAKKEKKPKEMKSKEVPQEPQIDVGRLDLRVAKIEEVKKHPDADTLYVLRINCGEKEPRTVCSGLVQQVPIEELQNRPVMLLCNLKPVKMRGITSEAMVMCACSETGVEVLTPPEDTSPGDHVHCEGFVRQPDHPVMNPKKKIFETVAPDLKTDSNLRACYKGVPLTVPGKGPVVAKSLANVPVK